MSMTDPIADFCTRIRNGYSAKKRWIDVPSSVLKKRLSLVLKEEGYIDNFVFVDKENSKEDIRVYLRYNENSPAITTIEKTKYSNFNMDPSNNILKFEIVDGTGPFLELIGQKCTAAYLPIESDKYLFKGKCDIPDANFLRMKNFKD